MPTDDYNNQNSNVYSMLSSAEDISKVDIKGLENEINNNIQEFCFCHNCGTKLNKLI